jgi:hypothetical protein
MKLESSRQIFEKKLKYQVLSKSVLCGRTDRQDEANSRFSQMG